MDLETYALLKKKINNISANNISYDNSQSAGLISTNVNDALDELSTKLGIKMVTVSELPLVGDSDILYIVPKSTPEQGNYSDEYTWNVTRQDYDKIGDTLISPLPDVTSSDNGKVLGVVNGEWDKYTIPKELPTVSSSDNGKVLSVVNGSWNKKSLKKSDVGLGNVDNTSDLNKPISTATQSALDTKLSEDDLYNMTEDSTVSGNLVTLKTLAKTNAKSCEVTFSPIQSGSGESSPSNIRPFILWDGLVLGVSGYNLWDEEWESGSINASGQNVNAGTDRIRSKNYIPVLPQKTYYFYNSTNASCFVYFYKKDNTFIAMSGSSYANQTFNTPADCYYIRFRTNDNYGTSYNNNLGINYPATVTTYSKYIGNTTHTATFPDTVYGGKVDFVSGKLVNDRVEIKLKDLTWKLNRHATLGDYFYASISGLKYEGNFAQTLYRAMCNKYAISKRIATDFTNNHFTFDGSVNNVAQIQIMDSRYSTADDFADSLTNDDIVIGLAAAPIEITLTPETIELLKGNNTLWTDGDNIEIVYTELDLTELPDVTSADEGKVLTVNSSGDWVAQTLPDGTNISY